MISEIDAIIRSKELDHDAYVGKSKIVMFFAQEDEG